MKPSILKFNIILFVFVILFSTVLNSQKPVINNPEVTIIVNGFQFVEGPVWKDGVGLLFSDIPANKVYLWTETSGTSVYLNLSGNSNGLALDANGFLLLAQHGPRQVARLESDNSIFPLATHYNGKRLNSPNDMAVHSDGSVFFTDPPYGLNDQHGTPELSYNGVFRLNPQGSVYLLDSTLYRPNGIVFSPNETKLYVSDSESRKIYSWDVIEDTILGNKKEFAFMQPAGNADGMKVDTAGYLYVAGPLGIWLFDSLGVAVDTIPIPGQTTNCGWGDEDHMSLYVTSGNAVYKIRNKTEPPEAHMEWLQEKSICFGMSYPNPFSETIEIPFRLDKPCLIKIDVYNFIGERVVSLVNQKLGIGLHTAIWPAYNDSKGVYLVFAIIDNSVSYSFIIEKI